MLKYIFLILVWGACVLMLHHFLDLSEKFSLFIFIAGLMLGTHFREYKTIRVAPVFILIALLGWLATLDASNNRNWSAEISILPKVKIENNLTTIENFRNFTWQATNNSNLNWETRQYDLSKLHSLYLYVVPFGTSEYMAHTMLGFGFEDQGNVVVSVETRKEKNEEYGLVAGALRQLELIYIFGSEHDLLTLRAVHRGAKIHMYPVKAEPKFIVTLFKDLASSANRLHEVPRFYRTLRDNCTTTLVEHIDRHYTNKIGLRLETIFPAKAGKLLYEFGRMDTNLTYLQAHEVSRIDHLVKEYAGKKKFSSLLHERIVF